MNWSIEIAQSWNSFCEVYNVVPGAVTLQQYKEAVDGGAESVMTAFHKGFVCGKLTGLQFDGKVNK